MVAIEKSLSSDGCYVAEVPEPVAGSGVPTRLPELFSERLGVPAHVDHRAPVFEVAPDADTLLITEGDSSADDIVAAEAAAFGIRPPAAFLQKETG